MVQRQSLQRRRLHKQLGENVSRWRRINGLTATGLAERAAVTRATLRSIERGDGTAGLDSLLAVLGALGVAATFVVATDPYQNNAARARSDDILARGGTL